MPRNVGDKHNMMNDVAQMVMGSHYWASVAVAMVTAYCLVSGYLTFRYIIDSPVGDLRARLAVRAALCLDRTGVVGAVIARHTLLVTMNVVALNLSLHLLSALHGLSGPSRSAHLLEMTLETACGVCIALVLLIAILTFALCNEIVRQAERGR